MTFPHISPVLAKAQADRVAARLLALGVKLKRTQALEAVAAVHGAPDWNTFLAGLGRESVGAFESAASPEPDLVIEQRGNVPSERDKERFMGWAAAAIRERASQMVIDLRDSIAEVRPRIDGKLESLRDSEMGVVTSNEALSAVAAVFPGLGDGSMAESSLRIDGRDVFVHCMRLHGARGPKLIVDFRDEQAQLHCPSFEQLGFSADQAAQMHRAADRAVGLFLFAGVSNSGKNTTLKTFIETHPRNGRAAFYSVERQIKYPIKGVHQMQVQRDLSDEDDNARVTPYVKAIMRADPDGVFVGEIRDRATASVGQVFVETGHMAFGTLHAHRLSGIVPRLTNREIGMSRSYLAEEAIALLVYQGLLPRLCPHCRLNGPTLLRQLSADVESRKLSEMLQFSETRFGLDSSALRFRNTEGCSRCGHRGTIGQTVVAEICSPDETWRRLTGEGNDAEAMRHYQSASDGRYDSPDVTGKTVFEHALYKASLGLVDPRECQRFESFFRGGD